MTGRHRTHARNATANVGTMSKTTNIQRLIGEAKAHLDNDLTWYRQLPDTDKELLNLIVQTAVVDFISWFSEYQRAQRQAHERGDTLRNPAISPSTDHLFFVAPFEFTESISLRQTLDTIRLVVDSMEENIDAFVGPDEREDALIAMLYYSREVAFSAAGIYAQAAEARGAWDARLEALIIEDLIDGTDDPNLPTRLRAADWNMGAPMFALAGQVDADGAPTTGSRNARGQGPGANGPVVADGPDEPAGTRTGAAEPGTASITTVIAQDRIRAAVHTHGGRCLMSMRDEALVVLVALPGPDAFTDMLIALNPLFSADAALCVGPTDSGVEGAARTLRAALNARRTACALPQVPRPLSASDVLPERALAGDDDARMELYEHVYCALRGDAGGVTGSSSYGSWSGDAGSVGNGNGGHTSNGGGNDQSDNPLFVTVRDFLLGGGSLEATARRLNVHPNTVRYRLNKSVDVTGWDPTDPRDAYVLLTAIKIGMIIEGA